MSLIETISNDIKSAMLAKEKDRLESLRAIKAALMLLQTEKGSTVSISQDAEIKLLQKLIKQRKEAAEIYSQQNRTDLAEKEISEALVIEKYLPKQLSEDELIAALKEIIAHTGASSAADFGKVMGAASKQLAGKADGKLIAEKVKSLLS